MKKLILLFGGVLMCALTFAQTPTGILTIFSEDGHKFFLILNGQRQNDKAETNIRVERLTQQYYSGKIIFEDKALGEISKNIQIATGGESTLSDVTYKIKAGKDGKQVLRFYSANPITVDAPPVRPEGVVVYNSGVTTPVSTTVTQTTITETTGANANVNVNGMGVNMSINVPANGAVMQQTTTTTTTSSSSSSTTAPPPASSSACNGYPMAPGDYQSAKSTIEQASFEESKLSTAKEIAAANCLYAGQVAEICRLFGFENTKLDFAKYAYRRCIDPQNYFKVNNVFDFDASKTELSNYIRH
jgi:hypothetical protein